MLGLCQHNTLAYYAFYYAGIFDAGLQIRQSLSNLAKELIICIAQINIYSLTEHSISRENVILVHYE